MNESQLYEALGRKQALIESQNLEYGRLLELLANVVSGNIAPERVTVDLVARTWKFVAPEEVPTRNGVASDVA